MGSRRNVRRGPYSTHRKRQNSAASIASKLGNVQATRDKLYAASTIKDETSRFMLAECAALARAEYYRLLKKRATPVDQGGGLSFSEEQRLPSLYNQILRTLKALGNLKMDEAIDLPDFERE